jgi:hypothetical protein
VTAPTSRIPGDILPDTGQSWPSGVPIDASATRDDALAAHFARAWPTPQTTVEAIMCAVRERGLAALRESTNLELLARSDAAAHAEINHRIEALASARRE